MVIGVIGNNFWWMGYLQHCASMAKTKSYLDRRNGKDQELLRKTIVTSYKRLRVIDKQNGKDQEFSSNKMANKMTNTKS